MIRSTMLAIALLSLAGCNSSNNSAVTNGGPANRNVAKSAGNEERKPQATSIPFVLTKANNISVAGTIDGKHSVNLMFHTGVDSVSLTKDAVARLASLKLDKSEKVSSWGGTADSRFGENHSLQIGELNWEKISIGECEYSGPATDGKFGLNLFAGKILAIDFDAKTITLHTKMPALDTGYQKLDLTVKDNLLFLEGTLHVGEKDYKNTFMIHSGFGGTLLLDDEFVTKHKLADQLQTISETNLKDSYGNIVKTRNVSVPSFRIGNSQLEKITIGLFDASLRRQKLSVLGGNLLKRFNIVLDLKHSAIYLKPSKHFADRF